MKKYLLIAFLSFFALTNCSVNDNGDNPQIVRILWNLENVTGGIAGVNNNFSPNVVVWEFNLNTSVLIVTNTNTNTALEDGLDAGSYTFQINRVGNYDYLSIANNEVGRITITETTFILDQNEKSTGTTADGYIYKFKKYVVTE